jgi:hypothetical protein
MSDLLSDAERIALGWPIVAGSFPELFHTG